MQMGRTRLGAVLGGGGGTLGVRGTDSVASEQSMRDGRRREDGRVLESIVPMTNRGVSTTPRASTARHPQHA